MNELAEATALPTRDVVEALGPLALTSLDQPTAEGTVLGELVATASSSPSPRAPARYSSKGFLRGLARFALPAGTAAGLGALSSYLFALNVLDLELVEARTVAVTVLVLVGLYLILALEAAGRVRGAAVSTLCIVLLIGYVLVLLVPFAREFFSLASPSIAVVAPALAGAALAIAGLAVLDDRFIPGRPEQTANVQGDEA